MTDLDALLAQEPIAPATGNGAVGRRCGRHQWRDTMLDGIVNTLPRPAEATSRFVCGRCGKPRDEVKARRGNNNRKRGGRIQRERIVALGGRNLAGNNPNLDGLGSMFAYESKSGSAFSDRYWRWLSGIPKRGNETGVLIVTEAPGPGRKARSYVVVEFSEWRDLHGESGPEAA